LRWPLADRDTHRPAGTTVDKLAGVLGVIAAFLTALTWELAAWAVAAMVLGGLVLPGAVLFAPGDAPADRLRALLRAWRDPVSVARSTRRLRDGSGPFEHEAQRSELTLKAVGASGHAQIRIVVHLYVLSSFTSGSMISRRDFGLDDPRAT
jgi:hypothetical protein